MAADADAVDLRAAIAQPPAVPVLLDLHQRRPFLVFLQDSPLLEPAVQVPLAVAEQPPPLPERLAQQLTGLRPFAFETVPLVLRLADATGRLAAGLAIGEIAHPHVVITIATLHAGQAPAAVELLAAQQLAAQPDFARHHLPALVMQPQLAGLAGEAAPGRVAPLQQRPIAT